MHASHKTPSSFASMSTLAVVLVLSYFCYHAVSGERGLLSLVELSKKVEAAKMNLDIATSERIQLEHRVSLLRDESLDLDLLDEQARNLLGYVGTDEIVYTNNEQPKCLRPL